MIGGVGAADDVGGQAALGLVARERLERRCGQDAAKIPDHCLDHCPIRADMCCLRLTWNAGREPARSQAWRYAPRRLLLRRCISCALIAAGFALLAASPAAGHRRRRCAGRRWRRPRGRHDRRIARQFLHRRADRAEGRADRGALRAARRGLPDRRLWRGRQQPTLQDVKRIAIHPAFRMDAMLGAPRHRRRRAAAACRARRGQGAGRAWRRPLSRSSRHPLHHRRHRRDRARRRQERRHHPRRGAGRDRQAGHAADPSRRSGRRRARATASAPAPAIPARRCSRTSRAAPRSSASSAGRPARTPAAGCGGITGVTPLTLYRDWIAQTARQWGAGL